MSQYPVGTKQYPSKIPNGYNTHPNPYNTHPKPLPENPTQIKSGPYTERSRGTKLLVASPHIISNRNSSPPADSRCKPLILHSPCRGLLQIVSRDGLEARENFHAVPGPSLSSSIWSFQFRLKSVPRNQCAVGARSLHEPPERHCLVRRSGTSCGGFSVQRSSKPCQRERLPQCTQWDRRRRPLLYTANGPPIADRTW